MIQRKTALKRSAPPRKKRPRPPRRGPERSPEYLAWIRTQPCILGPCFPGIFGNIESAHCGAHGMSQKASDYRTLPVCHWHHQRSNLSLHRMGTKFWEHWSLDMEALIAEHRARYEREHGKSD